MNVVSDGKQIAVGCTAFSNEEVEQLIGQSNVKPIVHYDYLYIDGYGQ